MRDFVIEVLLDVLCKQERTAVFGLSQAETCPTLDRVNLVRRFQTHSILRNCSWFFAPSGKNKVSTMHCWWLTERSFLSRKTSWLLLAHTSGQCISALVFQHRVSHSSDMIFIFGWCFSVMLHGCVHFNNGHGTAETVKRAAGFQFLF